MEALIAVLLANIGKFLNYLNINPRLQNKIMTVVSIFPTLYILRIVRGYFSNNNYIKGSIYLIIFIILTYFIIINFVYYFKNRKVKWDVTNFIEDIVPEDLTFDNPNNITTSQTSGLQGKKVPLVFNEESPFIIEQIIDELIQQGQIKKQDLEKNAYLIGKYELIPFYKIRNHALWIGSSYRDMKEVAKIKLSEDAGTLIPLGVFILGGTYQIDGITYKEPYTVQLRVKGEEDSLEGLTRSSRSKK
ncbi:MULTISPECIES: DUF6681 family protein [Vagococcus]|uniref:Uncharacterized protein n=1 Tax=Vagococcus fluvialis bH819 TaxID=1255619 RepID=A0A1X6WMJ3_9ENTE|nr:MULTISPECIES: DUF6681 family protein [Vagococcus]SLM85485.1 unknown [Vagococcus fluvialis bH819]HCM89220.1 hypothetical protein [Vagococcus sp.]